MAEQPKVKNTIQSNIKQNTKNYSSFSYFLGGIDVTDQNLNQFTPYIRGVSRIFMYKTPPYMDKLFKDKTANFKSLIETGYTRVTGIGDLNATFVDFEGGFAGERFSNISETNDDTDTITVSLYEQSGSPVREYLDTWITGVRDPRSGLAHYHGAIDATGVDHVAYSERNHTAEFIYYTLDPTGREIEYACMFAKAMPTKVPKSHLDYEQGDHSNVLIDIEFKVKKYESSYINQIAQWHLAMDHIKSTYIDFNPNITMQQVKDAYSLTLPGSAGKGALGS